MKRYAIVNAKGIVDNVILWDEAAEWSPPEGTIMVKAEDIVCGIGWKYENEIFTDPNASPDIPAE